MSCQEKSARELKREKRAAGKLLTEIKSNLAKLEDLKISGLVDVPQIYAQLKTFERNQADRNIAAETYMSALENTNNRLIKALKSPTVKEAWSPSVRLSQLLTSKIQKKQELGTVQTPTEPKVVEAKVEAGLNVSGEEKVATKIEGHDARAEQAEQEVESDEDVVFLNPAPVEEKVTTKIGGHDARG